MTRKQVRKRKRKPKQGAVERALRRFFGGIFRLIWWVGLRAAILGAIVLAVSTAYFVTKLPSFDELLDGREGGSVTSA